MNTNERERRASSGVDAGRTGRHRTRLDAGHLAPPGRTRPASRFISSATWISLAAPARSASTCRSQPSRRRGARPSRAHCRSCHSTLSITAAPGKPDASSAPAAIASIRRAVADVLRATPRRSSPIRSPRTCSIAAGFAEPGHTEFLGQARRRVDGEKVRPVMMLWSPRTRGGAGDNPFAAARGGLRLTTDLIVETGRIVAHDLPRGLPFGGRGWRLPASTHMPARKAPWARKTSTIVAPAVEQLRAEGIDAAGRSRPTRCSTQRRARDLRCRAVHVSRSGAHPDQDARLRPRRQRDARACLSCARRPTTARPSISPGQGSADPSSLIAALAWPRGSPQRLGAPRAMRADRSRDRRSAAAARHHPPPRPCAPKSRSARIFSSIST